MKKSLKIFLIVFPIVLVLITCIVLYYSLSNFAWNGEGGHVDWIHYSESFTVFGDEGMFLSEDFIEENALIEDYYSVDFNGTGYCSIRRHFRQWAFCHP